jgi:hypothetical protein
VLEHTKSVKARQSHVQEYHAAFHLLRTQGVRRLRAVAVADELEVSQAQSVLDHVSNGVVVLDKHDVDHVRGTAFWSRPRGNNKVLCRFGPTQSRLPESQQG